MVRGKKCVMSFPGIYEELWEVMTTGMEQLPEDARPSTACVFYDQGHSLLFGKHFNIATERYCGRTRLLPGDCFCKFLYPDGVVVNGEQRTKAPWGCFWFHSWCSNCEMAKALGQQVVIVYKREGDDNSSGAGDNVNGLGNSQRAEVRWLIENGFEIRPENQWTIDEFANWATTLSKMPAETFTAPASSCTHRPSRCSSREMTCSRSRCATWRSSSTGFWTVRDRSSWARSTGRLARSA